MARKNIPFSKRTNNFKDFAGKRFGRLTTVKHYGKDKSGNITWVCECDCGNETIVRVASLFCGNTKSCGCLIGDTSRIHGMDGTPTYRTWDTMKRRCLNPNSISYESYGGRGIKVCKRWLKFENFYADMGEKPNGTSLDRIDNDGDYEPSNCRWATYKQQARNRSSSRLISYGGKLYTMAELVEKFNINRGTLEHRISVLMWPIEKALTHPLRRTLKHKMKRTK